MTFFRKLKKKLLWLGFSTKFHDFWRFYRFWPEFLKKNYKKKFGAKICPFSSIIHVSIVFRNGHLQSSGPKFLGHTIYRWKDNEKFYPLKLVRPWTIYMACWKIQLKLPLFRDFADFVESGKDRWAWWMVISGQFWVSAFLRSISPDVFLNFPQKNTFLAHGGSSKSRKILK